MAKGTKNTKKKTVAAAPKKDAATPDKSAAADAPKTANAPKAADAPKTTDAKATDAGKTEGGETAGAAPKDYSRGEGQKPVTQAYKDNWNAIFGKKKR